MLGTFALILCSFVALEHLFIASIELFATNRPICSKIFKLDLEILQNQNIQTLFKNLGIYNLCLALGLGYGILTQNPQVQIIFLLFVFIVGIYGSFTSSKGIFFKQALPALIALVLLAFS